MEKHYSQDTSAGGTAGSRQAAVLKAADSGLLRRREPRAPVGLLLPHCHHKLRKAGRRKTAKDHQCPQPTA